MTTSVSSGGGSIQEGEDQVVASRWIARLHPVIFLPVTAYLSLVMPSITNIVAFTGALTVVPFMFVFPGLLLLHVQKEGLAFIRPSRCGDSPLVHSLPELWPSQCRLLLTESLPPVHLLRPSAQAFKWIVP